MQAHNASNKVPHKRLSSISKISGRNALADILVFGPIWGMLNHPIVNPNFSPPCGLLATPYDQAHEDSIPDFEFCIRYVS